ncbi:MAG: 50S ribosomal protein L10 [Candidatus Saliniplasma sp.]
MDGVPIWKKNEVERLTKLLKSSPVVGVVDIEGIPSLQMQQMRGELRGSVNLTVSRNTLITKAVEDISDDRENIEEIKDYLPGQTALVTTDQNPFKLFKKMEATKTKAPARGGETAPEDIKVEKGDTPFKPGPIVGDLQKAGIPASIKGGKVVINKTKVVVEEGEKIPKDLATMLTRLNIQPITVGLDLKATYEDGSIYERDVLDIDSSEFEEQFKHAALSAFNLSVNAGYPTKKNIASLIMKGHNDAFSLAINSDIINDETIKIKLSKAQKDMLSLAVKLDPDALDDSLIKELGLEVENDEVENDEVENDEVENEESEENQDDVNDLDEEDEEQKDDQE